ncbi:MAG: SurA N-terminal domain-containing protein [Nitrospira sp.]|nr:SurA N-terminal domain-containing protein [Nitrospira sp.]
MIKGLTYIHAKHPWFLAITMGFIAITFIIGMGWWGFGEQAGNSVASVGDLSVSRDEFKRAYENMYRFYKEKVPGEFKDETIKQFVIEQLVDNRLWLLAAKDMGITVSDGDLRAMIVQVPEFQKNGAFDPELYQRLLAANHLTPKVFEEAQAKEILGNKARMFVRDAVALTPSEISEGQALMTRQPDADPTKATAAKDRVLEDMLFQKQQRALVAFQESLKGKIPVKIHRESL